MSALTIPRLSSSSLDDDAASSYPLSARPGRHRLHAFRSLASASLSWSTLPPPLLSACFRFLPASSLLTVRLVCRSLSSASLLPASWSCSHLSWQQWLTLTHSSAASPPDSRNAAALHRFTLLPFYLPLLRSYCLSSCPPALFRSSLAFLPYCRSLRLLDLSSSPELDSASLLSLCHLRLLSLSLANCERVDDGGARHLAKMRQLQALDISGTAVTGHGLQRVVLSSASASAASPRLLHFSAAPQRFSFFSALPSLSSLLSLQLELSDCQQPASSSFSASTATAPSSSSRNLLHNNLCLHALSQLSPRLRLLQLQSVDAFTRSMSASPPSPQDWLLFFSSFTSLVSLQLDGLSAGCGLFDAAFCSRLFPYLAARLEVLELHFVEPEQQHRERRQRQAMEVWAAGDEELRLESEGQQLEDGEAEDDREEQQDAHRLPVAERDDKRSIWYGSSVRPSSPPLPQLRPSALPDRPALPITVFYTLPLLSCLSLHDCDVTPASPSHWQLLPGNLSCLTALQLHRCLGRSEEATAGIQRCLPRLQFASLSWAERAWKWQEGESVLFMQDELEAWRGSRAAVEAEAEDSSGSITDCHVHAQQWLRPRRTLPPYSHHAVYRDELKQRWAQAARWDKCADELT